jgi:thymidylate synthase (FAD)
MNIDILDKGFIKYVDHMGTDLSIVNSARVSFGKQVTEIQKRDQKLINYLWSHEHTTPFRHAYMTFHIKAPIFVLRQWQKHQVGCSWNEMSGRYVVFDCEFYEPTSYRKQSNDNKQGSYGEIEEQNEASLIYETAMTYSIRDYKRLIEMGVCKEQARMLLPNSLYTECYWTASLQAVMHFLKLREDSHAQLEIQKYAKGIRTICEKYFPIALNLNKGQKND